MSSNPLDQILDQALSIERTSSNEDEYEQIWLVLFNAREFGREAFDAAVTLLKGDASQRCLGCDLLLTLCNPDEENWSHEAAVAIVEMSLNETDEDVCCSVAQALGFTRDAIGIPILTRMSSHADDDVRFRVASALPGCDDFDHPNDPNVIASLLTLMSDSCTGVRDHATFGLAQLLQADSEEIRDALAERLSDIDWDTRREAMIGLARRRDSRAQESILEALREGDTDRLLLDAARYMADEVLLPYLLTLESNDEFVNGQIVDARRACDPFEAALAGASMREFLMNLDEALKREEIDVQVGLSCQLFEFEILLDIESRQPEAEKWWWSFEDLLRRSDGSVANAVSNVLADIRRTVH